MKKILFAILIIGIVSCSDEACTQIKLNKGSAIESGLIETQFVSDQIFLQNQAIIDSLNTVDELLDHLSLMPVD
jgi:hypothetical protein